MIASLTLRTTVNASWPIVLNDIDEPVVDE